MALAESSSSSDVIVRVILTWPVFLRNAILAERQGGSVWILCDICMYVCQFEENKRYFFPIIKLDCSTENLKFENLVSHCSFYRTPIIKELSG